jgi:hypothetical protein
LWLKGDLDREVPPIGARAGLIAAAAKQLAYPGGERLYQLLKSCLYWEGLKLDCVKVCSSLEPVQNEAARFGYSPAIKATWKGRGPFRLWAIELVTKL